MRPVLCSFFQGRARTLLETRGGRGQRSSGTNPSSESSLLCTHSRPSREGMAAGRIWGHDRTNVPGCVRGGLGGAGAAGCFPGDRPVDRLGHTSFGLQMWSPAECPQGSPEEQPVLGDTAWPGLYGHCGPHCGLEKMRDPPTPMSSYCEAQESCGSCLEVRMKLWWPSLERPARTGQSQFEAVPAVL